MKFEIDELIRNIIAVGKGNEIIKLYTQEFSHFNINSSSYMEEIASKLDQDELVDFYKGLIIAEKNILSSGGSVASNIYALKYVSKRLKPQETYELILWALSNKSNNPYTPFGSLRGTEDFKKHGLAALSGCESDYLRHLKFLINFENEKRRQIKLEDERKIKEANEDKKRIATLLRAERKAERDKLYK